MELITLHTKSITYQIGVNENGFLLHLYHSSNWGPVTIKRLNIQCSASYGYPLSVVYAVPNHQNHRITDIDTRGVVAMSGNFGYELDLTKLSQEEKDKIKNQIIRFKEDWNIIHNSDYYRVTPGGENREYAARNMVSAESSHNQYTWQAQGSGAEYHVSLRRNRRRFLAQE